MLLLKVFLFFMVIFNSFFKHCLIYFEGFFFLTYQFAIHGIQLLRKQSSYLLFFHTT